MILDNQHVLYCIAYLHSYCKYPVVRLGEGHDLGKVLSQ